MPFSEPPLVVYCLPRGLDPEEAENSLRDGTSRIAGQNTALKDGWLLVIDMLAGKNERSMDETTRGLDLLREDARGAMCDMLAIAETVLYLQESPASARGSENQVPSWPPAPANSVPNRRDGADAKKYEAMIKYLLARFPELRVAFEKSHPELIKKAIVGKVGARFAVNKIIANDTEVLDYLVDHWPLGISDLSLSKLLKGEKLPHGERLLQKKRIRVFPADVIPNDLFVKLARIGGNLDGQDVGDSEKEAPRDPPARIGRTL